MTIAICIGNNANTQKEKKQAIFINYHSLVNITYEDYKLKLYIEDRIKYRFKIFAYKFNLFHTNQNVKFYINNTDLSYNNNTYLKDISFST